MTNCEVCGRKLNYLDETRDIPGALGIEIMHPYRANRAYNVCWPCFLHALGAIKDGKHIGPLDAGKTPGQ